MFIEQPAVSGCTITSHAITIAKIQSTESSIQGALTASHQVRSQTPPEVYSRLAACMCVLLSQHQAQIPTCLDNSGPVFHCCQLISNYKPAVVNAVQSKSPTSSVSLLVDQATVSTFDG